METCDDEFVDAACDYIRRQHNRRKPFFCWMNTTPHMNSWPDGGMTGAIGFTG